MSQLKPETTNLKRTFLYLGLGLIVLWVAGIILVNVFNVDLDRIIDRFWNHNLGLILFILLTALFVTSIRSLRKIGTKSQADPDDPARYRKIILYFLIGVFLPIVLTIVFIFMGTLFRMKDYLDSNRDNLLVEGIGTLLAASGLPFIIRMLLLIKNELKAVGTALLLVPYGLALWFAIVLLMLLMFNHAGCC